MQIQDYDWVITRSGDVLHRMSSYGEGDEDGVAWWYPVKLDCGRTVHYATIPGPFTRMGAKRCDLCCDKNGYPRGVGSPKNYDACRRILGLPVARGSRPSLIVSGS